ncbi:WecB/TagA/CpsF family glycosyltransferase, partial [Candidatus Giovannonibacteria bacterium]|nr:WecB/TagA/CpsF family glycosyltransferase [Candidatus Giovannonibacteria bacterium]
IRKQELGIRGKIRQPADHNSLFIIPDSIDILFVAFGFPKQEEWMHEHLGKIPVRVMVGVGGAFDYISGRVPRAPAWVQKLGFEWLFRLVVQPWRIKRQLALLRFAFLVLREKCYNIDNGS